MFATPNSQSNAATSSPSCSNPVVGDCQHESSPPTAKDSDYTEEGYQPAVAEECVVLNIYDVFADDRVQAANTVFRAVGTGAFHAGVEIFGKEWSYGYTASSTGVVYCEPKGNLAHRYREAVYMGTTRLTRAEVNKIIDELAAEWIGQDYNLLDHNCCHFCNEFCRRLGVGPTPAWVTNLAGAGAKLVTGVAVAADAVNEAVGVGMEKAAEFDEKYDILKTVESFATREVSFDSSYIENQVQDIWSQAVQNIENVSTLASLAGRVVDAKTAEMKQVEAQNLWNWGGNWLGWGNGTEPKKLSPGAT